MGWGGSWVAARGVPREKFFELLRLRPTGVSTADEDWGIAGGVLDSGWCIAIRDGREVFPLFGEEDIARASKGAEAVYCQFEEHTMEAAAEYWRDGVRVWSVFREMGGPYAPLTVSGKPPPSYEARRKALFDKQKAAGGEQATVDYIYDLPHELAEELTGFTYDLSVQDLKFEVLAEMPARAPTGPVAHVSSGQPAARKPWWKIW
jgi:hypothetical protein